MVIAAGQSNEPLRIRYDERSSPGQILSEAVPDAQEDPQEDPESSQHGEVCSRHSLVIQCST
jgi:hypothetical protein